MVQIYNEPSLGKMLGTGIAQSLNALAENKMRQVAQRNQQARTEQGLQGLEGVTPEMAKSLSLLDPGLLEKALPGIQQQQREQQFSKSFADEGAFEPQDGGKQQSRKQLLINEAIQLGFPAPRNAREASDLAKIAHETRVATQKKEDAETLPYYEDLEREDKLATGSEKRLDKLKKLATHGKLGGPLLNGLINAGKLGGYGLDFSFLKTKDAQEFEKESASFIKNAKDIFGSRITDNDLSAFMKTVPTLANTREGMLAIINNMEIANEAAKIKKNAADKIIKENGGRRPINLKLLVEEMTKKEIDDLAEKFEVGKSRSTLLGSETLGAIPRALGLSY